CWVCLVIIYFIVMNQIEISCDNDSHSGDAHSHDSNTVSANVNSVATCANTFKLDLQQRESAVQTDAKPISDDAKPIVALSINSAKPIVRNAKPIAVSHNTDAKPIVADAKPIQRDAKPISVMVNILDLKIDLNGSSTPAPRVDNITDNKYVCVAGIDTCASYSDALIFGANKASNSRGVMQNTVDLPNEEPLCSAEDDLFDRYFDVFKKHKPSKQSKRSVWLASLEKQESNRVETANKPTRSPHASVLSKQAVRQERDKELSLKVPRKTGLNQHVANSLSLLHNKDVKSRANPSKLAFCDTANPTYVGQGVYKKASNSKKQMLAIHKQMQRISSLPVRGFRNREIARLTERAAKAVQRFERPRCVIDRNIEAQGLLGSSIDSIVEGITNPTVVDSILERNRPFLENLLSRGIADGVQTVIADPIVTNKITGILQDVARGAVKNTFQTVQLLVLQLINTLVTMFSNVPVHVKITALSTFTLGLSLVLSGTAISDFAHRVQMYFCPSSESEFKEIGHNSFEMVPQPDVPVAQGLESENIVTTIGHLILSLLTSIDGQDIKDNTLRAARLAHIQRMGSFGTCVFTTFKTLWAEVSCFVEGVFFPDMPVSKLKELHGDCEIWLEKVARFAIYIDPETSEIKDSSVILRDRALQILLAQLVAEGDIIHLSLAKTLDKVSVAYTYFTSKLLGITRLATNCGALLVGSDSKHEPLMVYIHGKPGTGKTSMLEHLYTDVYKTLDEGILPRHDVFSRATTSEFWDGYAGQKVFVIDDFLQVIDEKLRSEQMMQIIEIGSRNAMKLNMASLEDKKATYFQSELVLITAQERFSPNLIKGYIQDPEAFYRRLHIEVQVVVNPTHINQVGGVDRVNHVAYDTKACTYNVKYAGKVYKIDYDAFVLFLAYVLKRHRVQQDGLDEQVRLKGARMNVPNNIVSTFNNEELENLIRGNVDAQGTEEDEDALLLEDVINFPGQTQENEHRQFLHTGKWSTNFGKAFRVKYQHCLIKRDVFLDRLMQKYIIATKTNPHFKYWKAIAAFVGTVLTGLTVASAVYGMYNYFSPAPSDAQSYNTGGKVRRTKQSFDRRGGWQRFAEGGAMSVANTEIVSSALADEKWAPPPFQEESLVTIPRKNTLRHTHLCPACNQVYSHQHTVIGNHVIVNGQCPNAECEQYFGKAGPKCSKNPTNAYTVVAEHSSLATYDKKVYVEGTTDESCMNVLYSCVANMAKFTRPSTGASINGFFIGGTVCILPLHFFTFFGENHNARDNEEHIMDSTSLRGFKFRLRDLQYHANIGEDTMIIKFNANDVSPKKSVVRHCVPSSGLPDELDRGFLLKFAGDTALCLEVTTIEAKGRVDYKTANGVNLKLQTCLTYAADTAKGDCGSIVFGHSPHLTNKLLGFHIAGSKTSGYAVILTREKVQEYLLRFNSIHAEMLDVDAHGPLKPIVKPQHLQCIDIQGLMPRGVLKSQPVTTKLVPSLLHNALCETTVAPAMLGVDGDLDPLAMGIAKGFVADISLDSEMLDQVVKNLANSICSYRHKQYLHRALPNDDQLLNGIAGDQWINAINMQSSAGHPWNFMSNSGKAKLVDGTPPDGILVDEVLARERDVVRSCKTNNIPCFMFSETLKDEKRPLHKVLEGKTRVFSVGSFETMLAVRRYFFNFMGHMMENHIEGECSVGINPHSQEWGMLFRDARSRGDFWVAGDYGAYDKVLPYQILMAACRVVNICMQDGKENCLVRERLMMACVLGFRVARGTVFRSHHGMPSGVPITAVLNSVCNSLLVRYVSLMNLKNMGIPPLARSSFLGGFKDNVSLKCYGDDHIIRVSSFYSRYINMQTLHDGFAAMGLQYTNADKTTIVDEFVPEHKLSYLKRKFVTHEGEIKAPLDLTSIHEMINWVRKSNSPKIAVQDNVLVALLEMTHYGQYKWNIFYNELAQACNNAGLSMPDYTFENMQEVALMEDLPCGVIGFADITFDSVQAAATGLREEQDATSQLENDGSINIGERTPLPLNGWSGEVNNSTTKNQANQENLNVVAQGDDKEDYDNFVPPPLGDLTMIDPEEDDNTVVPSRAAWMTIPAMIARIEELEQIVYDLHTEQCDHQCKCPDPQQHNRVKPTIIVESGARVQNLNVYAQGDVEDSSQLQTETAQVTSVHTTGITDFSDQASSNQAGFTGPVLNELETYRIQSIIEFLERPYLVSNFEWSSNSTNRLKRISFPDVLFSIPTLFDKIKNFRFLRGNIEIFVKLNGTQFHYGKLIGAWVPRPYEGYIRRFTETSGDLVYDSTAMESLEFLCACEHIQVSPTANETETLCVPFRSPNLFIDIDEVINTTGDEKVRAYARNEIGQFYLWVLNPLQGMALANVPPVDVSIFARFTDVQLGGYDLNDRGWDFVEPQNTQTVYEYGQYINMFSGTVEHQAPTQSGSVVERKERLTALRVPDNLNIEAQGWVEPEQIKKNRTGMLSKFLNAASIGAGVLSSVPVFGFPAAIAAGALKVASGIAGLLGYQRPANIKAPETRSIQYGNMAHTTGLDTAYTLALDPENKVSRCDRYTGASDEEMLLSTIVSRPGLLYHRSIPATTAAGTILFKLPVIPTLTPASYTEPAIPTRPVLFGCTPVGYIGHMFQYWRGTLNYKIQIVASSFHTGRLRVCWLPSYQDPLNYNPLEDQSNVVSQVVDIHTDTELDIAIPYVRSTMYSRTMQSDSHTGNHENGYLMISVVNTIAHPETAPPPIFLNVWVSGGADLQFARPTVSYLHNSVGFYVPSEEQIEAQAGYESEEHLLALCDGSGSFEQGVCMGENVFNLKDVLGRPCYLTETTDGNSVQVIPGGHNVVADNVGFLTYLWPLFRFWRGSIGYKVLSNTGKLNMVTSVNAIWPNAPVPAYQASNSTVNLNHYAGEGTHRNPNTIISMHEILVPYYSEYVMSPVRLADCASFAGIYGVTIKAELASSVFQYAGDDFRMIAQVGPPRLTGTLRNYLTPADPYNQVTK
ncbi:TPA_asm: polyprotein, partial [Neosmilaster georgianus associated picornavirus 4]